MNHELIKSYLVILLTWPVVLGSLLTYFLLRYNASIKEVLNNISKFRLGGFEASVDRQVPTAENTGDDIEKLSAVEIDKIIAENEEIKKEMKDKEGFTKYLFGRAQYYEFLYLDRILVPNTKNALNHISGRPTTKENFLNSFRLPPQMQGQREEKEAIVDALLTNELIIPENGLLKITNKGLAFLDFLNGLYKNE
jgi:hypothetical protein